jgi:FkbM family methyltransferase
MILNRIMTALRGMLWPYRGGGLRSHIAEMESRMAEVQERLREMQERMWDANHRLRRLLRHAERNCEVQGHQMALDDKDSLDLLCTGYYEPFETELIGACIKNGDVVVDIGANIGYYTLMFARQVGETGRVFAFEPDPANFSLLKRNVQRNGYRNVELIQKAVAAQSGTLRLYLSDENRGDHRVYNSNDGRPSIAIDAVNLSDYFAAYNGPIDFIKMDIQGSEAGALRGMADLLRKHASVALLTEFWPIGLHRFGVESDEFIHMLHQLDFEIFHVNEEVQRLEPADVHQLTQMYNAEKGNYTNLLCKRAA